MKRLLLAALVATLIGSGSGCCLLDRMFWCTREYPVNLRRCGPNCGPRCGLLGMGGGLLAKLEAEKAARNAARNASMSGGPQTGAVAYPYYTTRGPRDFLANNPGDIGP